MSDDIDRHEFERRAQAFFESLKSDIESPPLSGERAMHFDAAEQSEASANRLDELIFQLQTNDFDRVVKVRARSLAENAGHQAGDLDESARAYIKGLMARAEAEAMRFHLHWLANPTAPYIASDPLFHHGTAAPLPATSAPALVSGISVGVAIKECMKDKQRVLAEKTIVEMSRVLSWFAEHYGTNTPLKSLDRRRCNEFNKALLTLERGLQGRGNIAFADRQTAIQAKRISSKTAAKYWSFVLSFFSWAERVGEIDVHPARDMGIQIAVGDRSESPEPFTSDEVRLLLNTPIYAGHRGKFHYQPGPDLERGSHYWTGLLGMFTGARAGEIAQLLTTDFDFKSDIPVINFRRTNSTGAHVKTLKNDSSERDVPVAQALLDLGLEAFVVQRLNAWGENRLFRDIRLGRSGNKSDGMSKWWGEHLRRHGLWKPGRATHVWRHCVTDILRNADVPIGLIDALVGHKDATMTGSYGAGWSVTRKAEAVAKINYGFDMVALLKENEARLSGKTVDADGANDLDDGMSVV